ncbi:MAG: hypothetical protein IKE00_01240 [Oscillospiraceae bacterium]|nr:hypothetical protein [Oscillospiraceae bacterium]
MKQQIMKKYILRVIVTFFVLAVSSFPAYCDMIVAPNVPVSRQEETAWLIGILAVLLLLLVLTVIRIRKSRHKKLGWILLACAVAFGTVIAGVSRIHRKVPDPVDLRLEQINQNLINMIDSAEDLVSLNRNNTVFVGTVVSVVDFDPSRYLTRQIYPYLWYQCHYVDAVVRVEPAQVYSGRSNLAGREITVRELLMIRPDGTYEPPRLLNEDISRAVFCTNWFSDDVFVLDIPEYDLIPIQDDGSISIWPYLEHAGSYQTLDSFESMTRKQLGPAFGLDLDQIRRNATDEELTQFRNTLEQPEYNCYIRAVETAYGTYLQAYRNEVILATVEERFRSSDAVQEATNAQKQAFETVTGQAVSSLWRMNKKTARKLTDTSDIYPNWFWDTASILVELDSDPGYCYYVPSVEIKSITPLWATLSAQYGSVQMDVSLRYSTCDETGEPVLYTLSFTWDRVEKKPTAASWSMIVPGFVTRDS